jgi:hypothetical protein
MTIPELLREHRRVSRSIGYDIFGFGHGDTVERPLGLTRRWRPQDLAWARAGMSRLLAVR